MSETQPQSRRGLARRITVQALYQWLINEATPETLMRQFREQEAGLGRADPEYFAELLNGCVENAPELTLALAPPALINAKSRAWLTMMTCAVRRRARAR